MKFIIKIFFVFLIFGCSNTISENKKLPIINLIVEQDKYSLILKHYFNKNINTFNDKLNKLTVKTNLSFKTDKALSNDGNNKLNIVSGKVDYKIFNISNKEVISGSLSSSINTGNISSLYGIDENNNFAKERISRLLASKLFRRILLSINSSEN